MMDDSATSEEKNGNSPKTHANVQSSITSEIPSSFKEWLVLLLRPTAISAIIGLFGTIALVIHETQLTKREAQAQAYQTERDTRASDLRFYTNLIVREEESKRALRIRMLEELLRGFLRYGPEESGFNQIDQRILSLELLGRNFSDSLDLKPIFISVRNEISRIFDELEGSDHNDAQIRFVYYQRRLRDIANNIKDRQLAKLGTGFDIQVPLREIGSAFHWPADFVDSETQLNRMDGAWANRLSHLISNFELEGVSRELSLVLSNPNLNNNSVQLNVIVRESAAEFDNYQFVERSFRLDFFDFPIIENIELSEDHRLSIVMNHFTDEQIHISVVYFPGVFLYGTSIRSLQQQLDSNNNE
jgi:hypothetical protein